MTFSSPLRVAQAVISAADFPFEAALADGPRAIAVITGIEGAAYRPVGAVMVCDAEGRRFGTLSSGCIERDVALHAVEALKSGEIKRLRYGRGSPFLDLQLPCGGGLDITILPRTDRARLAFAQAELAARRAVGLDLGDIRLQIRPDLRFLIFGKGPELVALSALAQAAGYLVESFSPDPETVAKLSGGQLLSERAWPEGVAIDGSTAIALFFHDHDWEPPLLAPALRSEAFYIGAQGSRRAALARNEALSAQGMQAAETARLAAPFGLIPSVRDPRTLAVSVLADALAAARLAGVQN